MTNFSSIAAHCFERIPSYKRTYGNRLPDLTRVTIYLNEHDTSKNPDCEDSQDVGCLCSINMNATGLYVHQQYEDTSDGHNHRNDIAILKLKWPISFDADDATFMKPACLPLKDEQKEMDLVDKTLTVVGFGKRMS